MDLNHVLVSAAIWLCTGIAFVTWLFCFSKEGVADFIRRNPERLIAARISAFILVLFWPLGVVLVPCSRLLRYFFRRHVP